MTRTLALVVLLTAVALAGCVNKAQPSGGDAETPTQDTSTGAGAGATDAEAQNNTTGQVAYKPPVARMQVFGSDGVLAFESDFVAANTTAQNHVQGGEPIKFLGSDSSAVERNANVVRWLWSFGDGGAAQGRSVDHTFSDLGGLFPITLTVYDSNGMSDDLVVRLPVEATRTFNQSVNFSGSLPLGLAGVPGQLPAPAPLPVGDTMEFPLNVTASQQGLPVQVVTAKFTLTPGEQTSDFDLYLVDSHGNVTAASANNPAPGIPESISLTGADLKPGSYTLRVQLYLGAQGTFKLDGGIVYRVVNPAVPPQASE